jgi:hypothetical protein
VRSWRRGGSTAGPPRATAAHPGPAARAACRAPSSRATRPSTAASMSTKASSVTSCSKRWRARPGAVRTVPSRLLQIDAALGDEQQLHDPVAAAHQVAPHLLASVGQVSGRLYELEWDGDRAQLARHREPRQQPPRPAIGLHPVRVGRAVFPRAITSIAMPRLPRRGIDRGVRPQSDRAATKAEATASSRPRRLGRRVRTHWLLGAFRSKHPEMLHR